MNHQSVSYKLPEPHASLIRCVAAVAEPVGDQVLVQVCGCGVCHSDVHIQDGYFDLGGGKTLPLKGVPKPVTPGHEIAGKVIAKGPDARSVDIGQNVLVYPWIGCGACENCKAGLEHLCLQARFMGMFTDGGFATTVLAPRSRYVVPLGDMDPVQAAPLACSGLTTYSAIRKFGDALAAAPLVIFGAGGLGLMAIRLLAALGHQPPVVLEIDARRREAALELGARAALDPRDKDAIKGLRAALGGPILNILDLVGAADSVQLSINLLAPAGRLVIVGLIGGALNLSVPVIPLKSLRIEGSFVGSLEEMRDLVRLAQANDLFRAPITTRPLGEAQSALEDLRAGAVVGRIVLVPEAADLAAQA